MERELKTLKSFESFVEEITEKKDVDCKECGDSPCTCKIKKNKSGKDKSDKHKPWKKGVDPDEDDE